MPRNNISSCPGPNACCDLDPISGENGKYILHVVYSEKTIEGSKHSTLFMLNNEIFTSFSIHAFNIAEYV